MGLLTAEHKMCIGKVSLPLKVDVNRRATESLFGRGPIQEKIIKFADKFDKKLEDKRKKKKKK